MATDSYAKPYDLISKGLVTINDSRDENSLVFCFIFFYYSNFYYYYRMVTGSEEKEEAGVKIDGSLDTKVSDTNTFRALLRLRKSRSVCGSWLKAGAICVMLGRVDAQTKQWVGYGATFGSEPILEACKRKFADKGSYAKYYEDGCTFYDQGLDYSSGASGRQYECCDLQQCQAACVSFS